MDYDKALEVAENLQNIFEKIFILKSKDIILKKKTVNPMLIDLVIETGIKHNYRSHYVSKEDSFAHEVLLAIGTNKLSDEKRYKLKAMDIISTLLKSLKSFSMIFLKQYITYMRL